MLANAQGGNVDFVGFTMKSANFKNLSDVAQKYTAKLYGAVALTLGEREEVANTILSRDGEKLIVPIYKGTKRGVILIFQIFEDGKLVQIVGTPDPEIGNSTSGT
ncbi:hypothetical protein ACZ75_04170 [Massilia sp. NR 4-1]|nr:hypothetical protein ACZ75_04170 [Massilia sp. NR 4-1]